MADWGSHHVDIAHWGMDRELSGPVSVEARGQFPNPSGPNTTTRPTDSSAACSIPAGWKCCSSCPREVEKPGQPLDTTPEQTEELFGPDAPEDAKTLNRNGIMFIGEEGRVLRNRSACRGKAVDELSRQSAAGGCVEGLSEFGPHGQLLRVRQEPPAAVHARASWPSRGHGVPPDEHFDPAEAEDRVGPSEGADHRRRRSQRNAPTRATSTVWG